MPLSADAANPADHADTPAAGWHAPGWGAIARVLLKAGLWFAALNLLFALLLPDGFSTSLSLYNTLLPGRERLPYGTDPAAYNLTLNDLDAMFAAHVVSAPAPADEFRLLLLGDSATWGFLLTPEQTLAGQINAAGLTLADGRRVRAYNLGHPVLSLTKDLLLLEQGLGFAPDMVIWLVTPQSFPRARQLDAPLVQRNAARLRPLIATYGLALDAADSRLYAPDFWQRTIVGQRSEIAAWLRLQVYGVLWAVTGIDQVYPEYTPTANDFDDAGVQAWLNFATPTPLNADILALDVLAAGVAIAEAQGVPLLIVNEPMFIANGRSSDQRYNFWYPRWAVQQFRPLLAQTAARERWDYLDLWDAVPPAEFSDSPVHLTPAGSTRLAQILGGAVLARAGG